MSKLLTSKREAWARQFKPRVLRGKPIPANSGVASWYAEKLEALARELDEATRKEVSRLFRAEGQGLGYSQDASLASQSRILMNSLRRRMESLFSNKAEEFAEGMLKRASKANSAALHTSLKDLSGGVSLKTNFISGKLKERLKASVTENVGLISSIKEDYLGKVEGAVMRSVTTGNGLQDLVPQLEKIGGLSKNRARFIALDQTRKANAFIARQRMEDIGIKKFEWVHSGGSQKPRDYHRERHPNGLNGGIFSFDDPPVIDTATGEKGFPGQLVNCKCSMVPIIEFEQEESK